MHKDLVSVGLDVDGPLVRVSVLLPLLPEVARNVPEHDGLHNSHTLGVKEHTQDIISQRSVRI